MKSIIIINCLLIWLLFGHALWLFILLKRAKSDQSWTYHFCMAWLLGLFINTIIIDIITIELISFNVGIAIMIIVDLALILAIIFKRYNHRMPSLSRSATFSYIGLISLCLVVFIVMIFNGAAIDSLTDAWWHMAKINRLTESALNPPTSAYLTGRLFSGANFETDQLWHRMLAIIAIISHQDVPTIFNQATPWIAVISLISWFTLSDSILKDKPLALYSTLAFTLFLGGLNSYFRVFSWPGSVSYIILYIMIIHSIQLVETLQNRLDSSANRASIYQAMLAVKSLLPLIMILIGMFLIIHIHKGQIFLYLMLVICYCSFLLFSNNDNLKVDRRLLTDFSSLILIISFLSNVVNFKSLNSVLLVTFCIIVILSLLALFLRHYPLSNLQKVILILLSTSVYLILFIDWPHLANLFEKQIVNERIYNSYIPAYQPGWFGESLRLAKWNHQLQGHLLWNGLFATILAIPLYIINKTRGHAILASLAVVTFIILISPYPFTFLTHLVPAHGVYRIHMLNFSPIIIVAVISLVCQGRKVSL